MADVDTLGPHQASGPSPGHGRLPADLTSFVGRRHELTAVRGALTECRLVTLTGIGGVGKTRLALRVATSVRRNFPDGVWLIELADVHDPDFVVDVVATTLGVRDYTGRPPRDSLVEAMAEGARLLVLDNCEQVVDAVAELVQTLLERCAGLHVLTTSRELLGLGCETVIPVSPLTTPSRDRSQPVIKVSRFDAVALFAERAASAVPGFALTDDNTATIAKICARLDGLPLAIELAAARTRALSPEQILQRLIERRGLLTWSSRGVPPRQQTLKWSIGWSYDLCTPEEQQLWRRLSLFTGSFDIDDVEHICGEGRRAHLRGGLCRRPARHPGVVGGQVDHRPRGRPRPGSLPDARHGPWFRPRTAGRDRGRCESAVAVPRLVHPDGAGRGGRLDQSPAARLERSASRGTAEPAGGIRLRDRRERRKRAAPRGRPLPVLDRTRPVRRGPALAPSRTRPNPPATDHPPGQIALRGRDPGRLPR
ncbi:hypothetical protein GS921_20045 [Rhodococcus hoagii]|nr:hypothetical protein [Prescottella equi]